MARSSSMCKIVVSSCVVAIAVMIINAQGSDDDFSKVIALITKVQMAFNDGDLDEYVSLYTEDCRFFSSGFPEMRGRAGQPTLITVSVRLSHEPIL